MNEGAEQLAARACTALRGSSTTVIALAGPVAVGKSTLAEAVAEALRRRGMPVEVVSTDGFLLPADELQAQGLSMRKGFPESYDVDALRGFLTAVRDPSRGTDDVSVPVYSHDTYDIVPGARRSIPATDVLLLEGLNALYATTGLVDFGIYLDAALPLVERWYVERFVRLCAAAEPDSFYAAFAAMDADTRTAAALSVYRSINLPNLVEHIRPSRRLATVIVEKQADHRLGGIREVGQP